MARNQNRYYSILNGSDMRPQSMSAIPEDSSDDSGPPSPVFDIEFLEPVSPELDFDTPIRKNRQGIRFDRPPSMPIDIQKSFYLPNKPSLKSGFKNTPAKLFQNIKHKRSNTGSESTSIKEEIDTEKLNMIRPHVVDESTKQNVVGFYVRKSCTALVSDDFDNMLFNKQDATLHLSLTPNWLHSSS